ncbi:hypothetical protein [Maritalea sp.]|uniref:hypothetical protein n=1 Tax=Maritalea sp. TaxID=2003361 RepID=UPI0039E5609C
MARSLSTEFQAVMNGDDRHLVALFTFEFATTYGLWTGAGEKLHNGVIYRAAGSVLDVDEIEESIDGSVGSMVLKLSALPEKGLTDDVLIRLFDEDWHMSNVAAQLGTIDPKTGAIIETTNLFRGRIEDASFDEDETSVITANCASTSIDLSVSGGLYRNDATQRQIDPTDTSLVGIGTLNGAIDKDARWGQG